MPPLTRRRFLSLSAAAALLPAAPLRAATAPAPLVARPGLQQLAPQGYAQTPVWGFDGTAPGPEIRLGQGARLRRRLVNDLPQPTSVHWHGIRIDNAMDGVPGLTQDAVPPGASFDYDFTVPDAGTFWYHAHNRSMEQVARGLHGVLVVEEGTPPDTDLDLPLALDDWRLDPGTAAIDADFHNGHDLSHGGRIGNLITVNGRFDPSYPVQQNARLRLRLLNVANSRIFALSLEGLDGWIVALDGMPLDRPQKLTEPLTLGPAQRADLIVDVIAEPGQPANLVSLERDGGYRVTRFDVTGRAAGNRRAAPAALPPNPLPALTAQTAAAAPLHRMVMQGGAMNWLDGARLGDARLSGEDLAQLGKFWALNDQADRPETPFLDAARGETHRIEFVNDTLFPHAMHLHGHHFRAIADDGSLGPWRDTILIQPRETRTVALTADNPGDWLLHCHMLAHAAAGMTSWFRVAA